MDSRAIHSVLEHASVPEHSVAFMEAMSSGEPFLVGSYLFLAAADWLLAVGYPLEGEYLPDDFDRSLREALRKTKARDCWAICPLLPPRLSTHCLDHDHYYILPVEAPVPARLRRLAEKAALSLRVEEGRAFTPAHRRLWAEFLGRVTLPPNVRELYARTETVLPHVPGLSLLNAWDREGHLAACLVLDKGPRKFLTYLVGAHSKIHHTPYASDLLFFEMIDTARREGKEYLHLGLGVNEGIRRFKVKWGGIPAIPYAMASWREKEGFRGELNELMRVLASVPVESMSKRQYMASLPRQRRFAMLWEIERDGRKSWIGGTAHFFCYSFESSLRSLFERVDTVIFEGPLDQASLDQVTQIGRSPGPASARLIDSLDEREVRSLERVVCGPRGFWARLMGLESSDTPDVRYLLSETRHWMAFFSLWTGFLARNGWHQSVDLEAWHLAQDMGKAVRSMETIEEQVETLESIPRERIVEFFRHCRRWKGYIRRNVNAYLKGDLDAMMGTGPEFPSRTERVINRRDASFLRCMKPYLAEGRCAVFVGTGHMVNLRHMLVEAGFKVRRCR